MSDKAKLIICAFIVLLFAGLWENSRIARLEDKFSALSLKPQTDKEKNLESQIQNLQSKIDSSSESVVALQKDVWNLQLKQPSDTAWLEAGSSGFSPVETSIGPVLVMLKDIQPYANGYKAKIDVGNLTSASFNNLKIKYSWCAKKTDGLPDCDDNNKAEKVEPLRFIEGHWTTVELPLTPAEKKETAYIIVSLEISTLGLIPSK